MKVANGCIASDVKQQADSINRARDKQQALPDLLYCTDFQVVQDENIWQLQQ